MPQQAKSPARQGWPGQGFAGSVATLPMLATLLRYITSFAPLVALLSKKWHKRSRKPFKDFLLDGAAGGRRLFSFVSSGQVGPTN